MCKIFRGSNIKTLNSLGKQIQYLGNKRWRNRVLQTLQSTRLTDVNTVHEAQSGKRNCGCGIGTRSKSDPDSDLIYVAWRWYVRFGLLW